MSKQLIQKNVFIQKSKEKFNPDVIKKVDSEDKNRKVSVFKKTNQTYNSITNQNPDNIKTQKDLELEKDNPLSNIEQIILQKKKEREEQDDKLKPVKQKVLVNESIETTESIQNFSELKNENTEYFNQQKKIIETNKNKYEDIMKNLKNLGIVNK
jgi:hypothetical protein